MGSLCFQLLPAGRLRQDGTFTSRKTLVGIRQKVFRNMTYLLMYACKCFARPNANINNATSDWLTATAWPHLIGRRYINTNTWSAFLAIWLDTYDVRWIMSYLTRKIEKNPPGIENIYRNLILYSAGFLAGHIGHFHSIFTASYVIINQSAFRIFCASSNQMRSCRCS